MNKHLINQSNNKAHNNKQQPTIQKYIFKSCKFKRVKNIKKINKNKHSINFFN